MAALRAGLLLAAVLAVAVATAQAPKRGLQSGRVTVYYAPEDESFAREALQAARDSLPVLERALGLKPREAAQKPISITVTRSEAEFDALVGEPMKTWVQGAALPGGRIVIKTLLPAVTRQVVAHELVHVLLDELAQRIGATPPRWLHEGLAKLAADDFSEADRQILGEAVVRHQLVPLHGLEAAFAGNRDQVSLAYAESYTLVRFLHELQPGGGLQELLRNLALTNDLHRALLRTYGQPASALEAQWQEQVQTDYLRHGLPLSAELMLTGLMTVLALGAFAMQRRRRRLIRERLQEEELLRRMFEPSEEGTRSSWSALDDPEARRSPPRTEE